MGVTYMQLLFSAHETSQDRILATPLSPTPPPSPSIPHRTAMFARLEVTDEWRRPLVSFDSFLDICIFRKSLILGACAVTPGWLISAWLVWIFVRVRWGLAWGRRMVTSLIWLIIVYLSTLAWWCQYLCTFNRQLILSAVENTLAWCLLSSDSTY